MRRVLGIVLAGGASSRFGSDKALADVNGRPLIGHAIGCVARHAERVVLCGRPYPGASWIRDRPGPGLGPLGGLNGGLHHALARGYTHVLSIACDTPFVPDTVLADLAARAGPCVIADHPVIGIWPVRLAAVLDRFLADRASRSMRAWMRCCDADGIVVAGIANINRREDFDAWLTVAEPPNET